MSFCVLLLSFLVFNSIFPRARVIAGKNFQIFLQQEIYQTNAILEHFEFLLCLQRIRIENKILIGSCKTKKKM